MQKLSKENFQDFLFQNVDNIGCRTVQEDGLKITLYYNMDVKDENGIQQHIATWHRKANYIQKPLADKLKENGLSTEKVCFVVRNHNNTIVGKHSTEAKAKKDQKEYMYETGNPAYYEVMAENADEGEQA